MQIWHEKNRQDTESDLIYDTKPTFEVYLSDKSCKYPKQKQTNNALQCKDRIIV